MIMSLPNVHGVIVHNNERSPDYLYRISLKCLVVDATGRVLVVKENGRNWWDLPGGGMDHGEDVRATIAREMNEEVNMAGDFEYQIIDVEEPKHLLPHNFWQIRLVFRIMPTNFEFSAGEDGDEVAFIDPLDLKESPKLSEQLVYHYFRMIK
jgi:8-oxo-dGTP pyrophosphatase MutT (NUDIX family)